MPQQPTLQVEAGSAKPRAHVSPDRYLSPDTACFTFCFRVRAPGGLAVPGRAASWPPWALGTFAFVGPFLLKKNKNPKIIFKTAFVRI